MERYACLKQKIMKTAIALIQKNIYFIMKTLLINEIALT